MRRLLAASAIVLLFVALVVAVNIPRGEGASARPEAEKGGFLGSLRGERQQPTDVRTALVESRTVLRRVAAPGVLRPGSEVACGAPFAGKVAAIAKDEGDEVTPADVLFSLETQDLAESLHEAELLLDRSRASVREAQAELDETRRRLVQLADEPQEVTEARLRLRQAALTLEQAQARLDQAASEKQRAVEMFDAMIGSAVDVETSKSAHRVAEIQLRLAREDLSLGRDTLAFRERAWANSQAEAEKSERIAQMRVERAQADDRVAEVAVDRTRRALEKADIYAPIAGVVTARNVNHGELVVRGDTSAEGATNYIVSDLRHMLVYADVDEGDVVHVQPGQPATVRIPAFGERRRFPAQVLSVDYRAQRGEEVATFTVRLQLLEVLPEMRPGMSANVEIEADRVCGTAVPMQAVARRPASEFPAAEAGGGEGASSRPAGEQEGDLFVALLFVLTGEDTVTARVVETGIADDEFVVVTGMQEGERVVSGPYRALEELKDGAPVRLLPEGEDATPPKRP